MVEKWLQSKPNPYINQVRKVMPQRNTSAFSKKVAAHFGTPIQLFKDSDKDGVMNVFDCKPHNKRKQDVMHPQNFGSGVGDMYARQEQSRQNKEYQRMIKEMQRQEEQRLAELQRIQTPIYNTYTNEYTGETSFNLTDAQIVKIMGPKTTTAPTTTGSPIIKTATATTTPNKYISTSGRPMLKQTGPTITYTGQQAKNIMATGDPNKAAPAKPSILSNIGSAIKSGATTAVKTAVTSWGSKR